MPRDVPDESRIDIGNQDFIIGANGTEACNGCRKSKLRCSRDRPNCLHCRKTGLECVYESKRLKPGVKVGAVENLHRRLDDLERRFDEQNTTPTTDHASDTVKRAETDDSSAYDILALLARELPKLVNSATKRVSTGAVAHVQSGSKRRRLGPDDTANPSTAFVESQPRLPAPNLLNEIISAYFLHVHPWIPMIHQARFLQKYAAAARNEHFVLLLHAMTIAASKFVPDAQVSSHNLTGTRRWVIATALDCLGLENLQALIIVAFNDIGNEDSSKAWSLVGSLTRTVEYTQLTQEHEDGEHRPFCQPYASLSPARDWTELEERRRVFWVVFLLDRFCSVTMGWNTSLTSDDVCRRLPCDGHLWRKESPVQTPHFGIWEKSRGRIGNPLSGYVSRLTSPSRAGTNVESQQPSGNVSAHSSLPLSTTDMSTVGALAYNIEATESMSRIMSYFLQQKVNTHDQHDINSWLTRFKELDLRLVHWKMLLPQKWKANPNLTKTVPLMDPNLTTAHVTHNASMILLHQLIAYPPSYWGFRTKLPSTCSAEACYLAGVEIASITEKYLVKSPADSPIGIQFAFCLFIAARVLLVHWRYTSGTQLAPEFWSLLQSLSEMSRRWNALSESSRGKPSLFAKYYNRLQELYDACAGDDAFRINVMDYTTEINHRHNIIGAPGTYTWPGLSLVSDVAALSSPSVIAEFNTIPQVMLDQEFIDMDRVIAFDDGSLFASDFDPISGTW